MELICPSCEARYQVPERAIGEKGRQVSCLNCGHGWHAYPPLVLKSPAAAQKPPPPWQAEQPAHAGAGGEGQSTDWLQRSQSSGPTPSPAGPSAPPPPEAPQTPPPTAEGLESFALPPASSTRSDQLAEIREMLAEVQSEDRAAAALNPASDPAAAGDPTGGKTAAAGASSSGRRTADVGDDRQSVTERQSLLDQDAVTAEAAIRDKLNISDVRAMAPKPPDPKRLRRAHDRKETKRRRRESAGSGALLTCFLLVVMISAFMISLYLLHEPIIEKVPSLDAPLKEYVATVDSWRVGIAETFDGLTGWVSDRLSKNV